MNPRESKVYKMGIGSARSNSISNFKFLILSLYLCVSVVNLSCSSKPIDLRTLVPAESLVYLETNDLAAALQPIVDSKPFNEAATRKPDLSALKGVQVAVAITGFETSEEKLTDENSVGRVQPHFVAVADTHAWNYQAVAFAEQKLGGFVADIYGGEPKLEKLDKGGGKYFTWTADDGRKAFAQVIDSVIYFANDASAIDKSLAVKRGEADSIAAGGKVPTRVLNSLAAGYVSADGVAQIAAIAGLQFASQASDDAEVQSAVSGILPRLIRGAVTDISWSASQSEQGYEDKWQVGMPAEMAGIFAETMKPGDQADSGLLQFAPADSESVTQYNFENPQIAWRSVLLASQKLTDPVTAKMFVVFANGLFEPYGVKDGEAFLGASQGNILTVNGGDEDSVAVIAKTADPQKKRASQSEEIFKEGGVASVDGYDISGDTDTVRKCVEARNGTNLARDPRLSAASQTPAAVTSRGVDRDSAAHIADLLAEKRSDNVRASQTFITETRFIKTGMQRRTVSDFGFIGWLIAQLAAE